MFIFWCVCGVEVGGQWILELGFGIKLDVCECAHTSRFGDLKDQIWFVFIDLCYLWGCACLPHITENS